MFRDQDLPAVATARARTELATQKSDLDALFLALTELKALGDRSAETAEHLSRVQAGIPLLQKIRVYQADHSHEDVVKAAGEFLALFPSHPEARRAMKESGLLFAYLQEARDSVVDCFRQDEDGRLCFIETRTPEGGIDVNLQRVLFLLSSAEKAVSEAITLDRQFERALTLSKIISDTTDTLGYLTAYCLVVQDVEVIQTYAQAFDFYYAAMVSTLVGSRWTPSDVWTYRAKPYLDRVDYDSRAKLERMDALASLLSQLRERAPNQTTHLAWELHVKAVEFREAVSCPTGSLIDYRETVQARFAELSALGSRAQSSTPNVERVRATVQGFRAAVMRYELYKTPSETRRVLATYRDFIRA
jgi:hypothetical protein